LAATATPEPWCCGGTALILDRISYGRACELLFTGRRLTAAEALGIGLVDRVSARGTASSTALDIEDSYWREAALSPEYREGLAAFAERRTPDWAP
jgi:enoyl-CoA hydratase/carnithine racemase